MFTIKPPYYFKNPEWFYHDDRKDFGRYRLTDRATQKAIESFINDYAHYTYPYFENPNAEETFRKLAQEDIEDYKKNKHRYTLEMINGTQNLVAVDGKPIDE